MTLGFLITSLIVVATPGAGALYAVATGLAHGTKASVFASVGCTIGIVPAVLAAVTGQAAIMHSSAIAFQTVKWAGVAYLLYLSWDHLARQIRSGPKCNGARTAQLLAHHPGPRSSSTPSTRS